MSVYVNMIDKFLSGWGGAKNGRSLYSVECDDHGQAQLIEKAAHDRDEMKNVTVSNNPPRKRAGDHLTVRHVSQLGGPWLKYFSQPDIDALKKTDQGADNAND